MATDSESSSFYLFALLFIRKPKKKKDEPEWYLNCIYYPFRLTCFKLLQVGEDNKNNSGVKYGICHPIDGFERVNVGYPYILYNVQNKQGHILHEIESKIELTEWNGIKRECMKKAIQKPINNYIVIFGFEWKILKIDNNEFTESQQTLHLCVVIRFENENVPNWMSFFLVLFAVISAIDISLRLFIMIRTRSKLKKNV